MKCTRKGICVAVVHFMHPTLRCLFMTWLALDIGGVNLKAADGLGFASSTYFPLWRQPEQLPTALRQVIAESPAAEHLAITMTGELADCYSTKASGVADILNAVSQAAGGRPTRVYLNDGRLVIPEVALREPLKTAASNWHALAAFSCRYLPDEVGLLLDIGSTTTDIVPLTRLRPTEQVTLDPDRLARGELVYTGVERSPICAVVDAFPWRGNRCPVAHELFATTQDAYVTLGELPENANNRETADGGPLTKVAARDRLARCICADRQLFDEHDATAAAQAVERAQLAILEKAAHQVFANLPDVPHTVVVSGRGEFLARKLIEHIPLEAKVVSLSEVLGQPVSQAAAAHALAVLAREGNLS